MMFLTPKYVDAAVIDAPLYSQLMSLTALGSHEKLNGLSQWAIDAANQMSEAERASQGIIRWVNLDGLINLIPSETTLKSIPEFVTFIDTIEPVALRDQLFQNAIHAVHFAVVSDYQLVVPSEPADLLKDYSTFQTYFQEITKHKYDGAKIVDFQFAFDMMNDPVRLKQELISHINMVWHRFLEREWRLVAPRIAACVNAFQAINLDQLTVLEAIEAVTDRDLHPAFLLDKLLEFDQVRFVPHVHNGPYIIWFGAADSLIIGFPARELQANSPDFDKTTFVNRCKALADENRVAILLALAEAGTLSTADLIERFELDKSAASRHLRQLVATSLIDELRIDKAKKGYRLNSKAIQELSAALKQLE